MGKLIADSYLADGLVSLREYKRLAALEKAGVDIENGEKCITCGKVIRGIVRLENWFGASGYCVDCEHYAADANDNLLALQK